MIYFLVALSMRVFADISKEAWPKRRIWVNIESLVFVKELSISFINCAQEGASLISKQGAVKKKNVYLFQHQGHTNKMDSKYLENYVWIYAHASDFCEIFRKPFFVEHLRWLLLNVYAHANNSPSLMFKRFVFTIPPSRLAYVINKWPSLTKLWI